MNDRTIGLIPSAGNRDFRAGKFFSQRDSGGRFYRSPSLFWNKYQCLNYPERCCRCLRQEEECAASGYYEICYKKGNDAEYDYFYEK